MRVGLCHLQANDKTSGTSYNCWCSPAPTLAPRWCRHEVKIGQVPSSQKGAREGGDETLNDKEQVLFDGNPADGEPDAVTVIRPGTVVDDEVVPRCCPDQGDDGEEGEFSTVEFGEEGSSNKVEDQAEREGPEQMEVTVGEGTGRPLWVGWR